MGLDELGEWWLPTRPDRRCKGVLTFSEADGAALRLAGTLVPAVEEGERTHAGGTTLVAMTQSALERSGTYERIHGHTNNGAYTLENAIRTRRTGGLLSAQAAEEVIVADRAFRGAFFEDGETIAATSAVVGLRHLEAWIEDSGFSEDITSGGSVSVGGRQIAERSTGGADGMSIALVHRVGLAGDGVTTRSVTQRFLWRIAAPSLRPITDFLDVVSDLQDLLAIATARRPPFVSVTIFHPDVVDELNGRVVERPIEMLARWTVVTDTPDRPVRTHDLLFTFADLGGMNGIGSWAAAAARHRGPLGRVMSTHYSDAMLVSDRLLNCAAALEAFDRHTNPKGPFRTRVERCTAVAGPPFTELVGDCRRWAAVVTRERNDIAHHGGLRTRSPSTALYHLGESLYLLFVLCLLRDMHAPTAVFDGIVASRSFRHLKGRLPGALAAL